MRRVSSLFHTPLESYLHPLSPIMLSPAKQNVNYLNQVTANDCSKLWQYICNLDFRFCLTLLLNEGTQIKYADI